MFVTSTLPKILFVCCTLLLIFKQAFCQQDEDFGLHWSAITSTSIELSWSTQGGYYDEVGVQPDGSSTPSNPICANGTIATPPFTVNRTRDGSALMALQTYNVGLCRFSSNRSFIGYDPLSGIATGPPPVTDIRIFIENSHHLGVTWKDALTPKNYTVYYKPNSGQEESQQVSMELTIITGLQSNTRYTISITTTSQVNRNRGTRLVRSDRSASITGITAHDAPTEITVSRRGESLNINWRNPEVGGGAKKIVSYDIVWRPKTSNEGGRENVPFSNSMYLITELNTNTEYDINLIALDENRNEVISANISGKTVIDRPLSLILLDSDASTLNFSWVEPELGGRANLINGYRVSLNKSMPNTFLINGVSVHITNLVPNTFYMVNVAAIDSDNEIGRRSNIAAATSLSRPRNLVVDMSTNSSIRVSWSEPRRGGGAHTVIAYTVRYQSEHGHSEAGLGVVYETKISKLTSNTKYSLEVTAFASAKSASAPSEPALGFTIPSAPIFSEPCSVENSTNQICVSWMTPDGGNAIDSYTLLWSSGDDTPGSPMVVRHHRNTRSYNHTIESLLPGQTVDVSVTARNIAGTGLASRISYASNPLAPENVRITPTTNEITVQWERPAIGSVDAVVIKSTNDAFERIELEESNLGSYTIGNLTSGTTYEIVVYSLVRTASGEVESERIRLRISTRGPSQVNSGILAGVIVGIIALVLLLLILIVVYRRRRKQPQHFSPSNSSSSNTPGNLVEDNKGNVMVPITASSPDSNLPVAAANGTTESPKRTPNSRIVYLSNFAEHFQSLQENSNKKLKEEFQELSFVGRDFETTAASNLSNKKKNRYKNIHPYDDNRVVLSVLIEPESNYINASYVNGMNRDKEYIATQGPRPATVNDFVRMVWEQNCTNIVMLTELVENGKNKCERYWPLDEIPVAFGEISVQTLSESRKKDWIIRDFCFTKDGVPRFIHHYHYTAWPDHGVPDTSKSLVRFVSFVRLSLNKGGDTGDPTIVHCSAGVGRTGTFIAVDQLLQHLKEHQYVDIFGLVHEMRSQRTLMVQTELQYTFIHKMVQELINHEYDVIDDEGETLYAASSIYQNVAPNNPIYENL